MTRRVRAALDDLVTVALPERQDVLREQIALLEASTRRSMEDGRDVELDLRADPQGIGVAVVRPDRPSGDRQGEVRPASPG